MPVTGVVVTLVADAGRAEEALRDLGADPAVEIGPRRGPRVALVLDTADAAADDALQRRIADHPGVAFVDVVSAWFEEVPAR